MKRLLGWLLLIGFFVVTTAGLWLPPIISHAVEKDYHFPEVVIDAAVQPDGALVLRERRTFDFRNGPFTYAFFEVPTRSTTSAISRWPRSSRTAPACR